MNKSQIKSRSEHESRPILQRLSIPGNEQPEPLIRRNHGIDTVVYPVVGSFDPKIMRKSLMNTGPKKINFCDTNISKRVLKTRNFQEFQQQSEEEDIKTPLSQEINENNIFDQITLKTDKVKQTEQQIRFSKELGTRSLVPENAREGGQFLFNFLENNLVIFRIGAGLVF